MRRLLCNQSNRIIRQPVQYKLYQPTIQQHQYNNRRNFSHTFFHTQESTTAESISEFVLQQQRQQQQQSKRQQRKKYATWGIGGLSLLVLAGLFDLFEPLITQRFIVRMELEDKDEAFSWIMYWLTQHQYTQHCTNITVLSSPYHKGANSFLNAIMQFTFATDLEETDVEKKDKVLFVPGPGRHVLKYDDHLMWIDYVKHKGNEKNENPTTTLTITILCTNVFGGKEKDVVRRKLITDMVNEAKKAFTSDKHDKTTIYCPDRSCDRWEEVVRKPKRPISSVVLQENNTLPDLIDDLKQFIDSKQFYESRGIPHRRGYLLYGPPGSGKSSTVQALAGTLDYDIYLLNISSSQMSDEKLNYLLHQAPKNSIVLLEDVDSCTSATNQGELSDEEFHSGSQTGMHLNSEEKVTVSGLLNAIDGVGAHEGRIVFFTTNHVNRLQRALLRPGRIDIKREIGYITPSQAKQLFLTFYKDSDSSNEYLLETLADQFVDKLIVSNKVNQITPAMLQELFMTHKQQPQLALEHVLRYVQSIGDA
jgi:chaperone BCS1